MYLRTAKIHEVYINSMILHARAQERPLSVGHLVSLKLIPFRPADVHVARIIDEMHNFYAA